MNTQTPSHNVNRKLALLLTCSISFFVISCSTSKIADRGFKKLEKNKLEKATSLFNSLLRKDQFNDRAHYGLGEIGLELNQYEVALNHFTTSIELGNKDAKGKRAEVYYHLAKEAYEIYKNPYQGLIYLDSALSDNPRFTKALRVKPAMIIEAIRSDLDQNKPNTAYARMEKFLSLKDPYSKETQNTNAVRELYPEVLLKFTQYIYDHGEYDKALTYVEKILEVRSNYFAPYQKTAKTIRGYIYEGKSYHYYSEGNYREAFKHIQFAIEDLSIQNHLIHHRARIYHRLSSSMLDKNKLDSAFHYISSAIDEGDKYTRNEATKQRAEIYLEYSKQQRNIEARIKFGEKALSDNPDYTDARLYVSDLYLTLTAAALDNNELQIALNNLQRAAHLNPRYQYTLDLLKEANLYDSLGNAHIQLAKAEIYAMNMRLQEAIEIAEDALIKTHTLKHRAVYDLARFHAVMGNKKTAIDHLYKFYYDTSLRSYHKKYRNLASLEPDFLSLQADTTFHRWIEGIHRIQLSLKGVENIPPGDIYWGNYRWNFEKTDPIIQLIHQDIRLLTTVKEDDKTDITWPEERYFAVFDYDIDHTIKADIIDADPDDNDIEVTGSFSNLYPNNWNLLFENQANTIMHISVTDATSIATEFTTYNGLPEDGWFFGFFTEKTNDDIYKNLAVRYNPNQNVYLATTSSPFLTLAEIGFKIFPCAVNLGVSIYIQSFVVRQTAYHIVTGLAGFQIALGKSTVEAFIEYLANRTKNQLIIGANNFRVFCDCAYSALSE
ncbi:MAG: tetratricopeptide repeat protein [Bacteroidota bacterium]